MSHAPTSRLRACRHAICLGWLAGGLVLPAWGQDLDEELPLPRWDDRVPSIVNGLQVAPEAGHPFQSLLPGESLVPALPEVPGTLQFGPKLADTLPSLAPLPGLADLSLFLPGQLLQSAKPAQAPRVPTPELALRPVPVDVLASLADAPVNEYLLDPQNLVSEVTRDDLVRLLDFHAADARIRLHVLVLEADQKLDEGFSLPFLAKGGLERRPSCLAVYPLGEPWRARVFFSGHVRPFVTSEGMQEFAADCIRDAQQADDPDEQLHRYVVRISTRLFWLQKSLPDPAAAAAAAKAALAAEVEGRKSGLPTAAKGTLGLVLLMLLGVGGGLLFRRLVRQRDVMGSRGRVWMLPEPEVAPRLGGAFSAGAGAVLHYKD